MRPAAPLATFALAAALLAGCGSAGEETSTGPGPVTAPKDGTKPPVGASVRSCALAAAGTVRLRGDGGLLRRGTAGGTRLAAALRLCGRSRRLPLVLLGRRLPLPRHRDRPRPLGRVRPPRPLDRLHLTALTRRPAEPRNMTSHISGARLGEMKATGIESRKAAAM
jgi:hypothetical protein